MVDLNRERKIRSLFLLLIIGVMIAATALYVHRDKSSDTLLVSQYITKSDSLYASELSARRDSSGRLHKSGQIRHYKPLHLDLNSADSSSLIKVYGIGPVFSSRIVAYRRQLGGYASVEQLMEVRGISRDVFEKISVNFWVDSTLIQKININFATRKELTAHPYINASAARRIERSRTMEGGYYSLSDLKKRDILLPQEAAKLAPYLSFTADESGKTN